MIRILSGRGCLLLLGAMAISVVVLALIASLAAPPLFEAYARWLIVNDTPAHADAAVTLAGGDGGRLLGAIELYRAGRADKLLLVGPDESILKVYSGEDSLTQGEVKRRIAVRKGVAEEDALVALGATSTIEEALTARRVAREHGWSSVVVVTDPFHTRRARATFRHVFKNDSIAVSVHHLPLSMSRQDPEKWWRREGDMMAVVTETLKLAWYGWRYRVRP